MSIWSTRMTPEDLGSISRNTLSEHLGIQFLEVGDDYLTARMPVDHRTLQPDGILHGGASVVLAETLGSVAATLCLDRARQMCVGLEVNANHLRPVRSGFVVGTARPLHIGRRTQLWQICIHNEQGQLICVSRLTLAVLDREPAGGSP